MEGIDVHGSKGAVNWIAVRKSGRTFAWVKCTEGQSFKDERFAENRRNAKAAGIRVGGYHFARPDHNSAKTEADAFVATYGKAQDDELRPVLDFEQPGEFSASWALSWLRAVTSTLGVKPLLYTFPAHLAAMKSGAAPETWTGLRAYRLWFADYGPNDGKRHPVSHSTFGLELVAHQYTSVGPVPGVSGDVDKNFAASLVPLLVKPPPPWKLIVDGNVTVRGSLGDIRRWIRDHRLRIRKAGGANIRPNR